MGMFESSFIAVGPSVRRQMQLPTVRCAARATCPSGGCAHVSGMGGTGTVSRIFGNVVEHERAETAASSCKNAGADFNIHIPSTIRRPFCEYFAALKCRPNPGLRLIL